MLTKEKILAIIQKKQMLRAADLSGQFHVSRQYINRLIRELVAVGKLTKFGSTRSAFYMLSKNVLKHPEMSLYRYKRIFANKNLEEHKIFEQIGQQIPFIKLLPENIQSIFIYAFSEMLNNAIEHSASARIKIEVEIARKVLSFIVSDTGIGVFRNIMQRRRLHSEIEAIQDLLKGKTTTMPKSHSGEGIFFTSKAGDIFTLESFGYELIVNNQIPDIFVNKTKRMQRGTRVKFQINTVTKRHLKQLFQEYTDCDGEQSYGFDKTKIHIRLYTIGGVHVSRSQARRVLLGLEKFRHIIFDFDKVPTIGQAFADEVFRVFHEKYPHIRLETANMNEGVRFMVERAQ